MTEVWSASLWAMWARGREQDGVRYGVTGQRRWREKARPGYRKLRELAWWLSLSPRVSDCGGQGPGICISNKFLGRYCYYWTRGNTENC